DYDRLHYAFIGTPGLWDRCSRRDSQFIPCRRDWHSRLGNHDTDRVIRMVIDSKADSCDHRHGDVDRGWMQHHGRMDALVQQVREAAKPRTVIGPSRMVRERTCTRRGVWPWSVVEWRGKTITHRHSHGH